MPTFGEKLHQLRKALQLTQEELAEALNAHSPGTAFNRAQIANWEVNRNLPNTNKSIAIASFFKISLDTLHRPELPLPKQRKAVKT